MFSKRLFAQLPLCLACLGLMLVAWAMDPLQAQAQCGDYPPDSSCIVCHKENYPVIGKGEWHEIHAEKDCCWNCHGGNTQVQDKDLAHEGLTSHPLEDTFQDCFVCHPFDYQKRADRFGAALGVIPVNQVPTPRPYLPSPPNEDLQLMILPVSEAVSAPAIPWYPELVCLVLALAACSAFLLWNKAHQRSPSLTS